MKKLCSFLTAGVIIVSSLEADTIVTKNGSSINGRILGIEGGKMKIETDFAGEIEVDKAQIDHFSSDNPIFVSFESGSSYVGKVTGKQNGELTIETQDGDLSTSMDKVDESWQPGTQSPAARRQAAEMAKLERKWSYEAAFDLTGKSGNSDSTGLGTSFRAKLEGPKDTLQFYARANFEETDDVRSADDSRAGVDYANSFNDKWNWYVRSEFGRDVIKDIELYTNTAAGFGYTFTKTETRELNVRGGIGYRFEAYDDILQPDGSFIARPDLSSASADFGLFHEEKMAWGRLVNRLTYTPAFDDFANFRAVHDTSLELPMKSENYSIRLGLSNDYDSEADLSGKDELDTTYYIRLVLNWD